MPSSVVVNVSNLCICPIQGSKFTGTIALEQAMFRFSVVPPALLKVGHTRRPMLEIIAENPDEAMLSSTEKLMMMGYARA